MKPMRSILLAAVFGGAMILPAALTRAADVAAVPAAGHDAAAEAQAQIDKGLEFLKRQQQPDGSWQAEGEPPALTAIALRAFCGDPRYIDQPFVKKGFDKLLTFQKEDGSVSSDVLATYNTAIACSALAKSNDPKCKAAAQKAVAYLKSIQWMDKIDGVPKQTDKIDANDARTGGWGYGHGTKGRPDLSNAQVALEALHDAGLKPGDPAYDAALKFISRAQNRSESNDQPFAGNDGGFFYTSANGGLSEAGELKDPVTGKRELRSYGSMTYAGLKSMIYCGLTKDEPRVKAAWQWIRKNWTLTINPGMQFAKPEDPKSAESGLFYYYHTLARALRAYGEPVVIDSKGEKHDWRMELIGQLGKQQQSDGHWSGTQRWMEGRPNLSTAFAVLAAEEARDDLKEHPAAK